MNTFYTSGIFFAVTAAAAYLMPHFSADANNGFMLTVLIAATAGVTFYGVWQSGRAKKRTDELNRMILIEEKRTVGRFLIHEWRGLIHNIGIQAELMERAENQEGVRVNCGVIKKILHEETEETMQAETFFQNTDKSMKKSMKAIKKAVSDVSLLFGGKRIKIVVATAKKDMKSDYSKLYPCLVFALINTFRAVKNSSSSVTVTIAERKLGFTEFLEISVTGGNLLFDKNVEDVFYPFNKPSGKFRDYFGLSSVRRLASDMGGFAEAERSAKATNLYIVIPVTK